MRKQTTTALYPCRYPGCDKGYDFPQPRGRHESLVHGMTKGALPGPATPTLPATFGELPIEIGSPPPTPPADTPAAHIQRALSQLIQREGLIAAQLKGLEALRCELVDILAQKMILEEALEKLTPRASDDVSFHAAMAQG